ncbi:MAG: hypothetical protein ACPGIA_04420 [Luteolibacter sp.]
MFRRFGIKDADGCNFCIAQLGIVMHWSPEMNHGSTTPFLCCITFAITALALSQIALSEVPSAAVPSEIKTLMEQRDEAIERVQITFRREMRDLRARYVTQGRTENVELVEKILEGIDPYRVGDPVIGNWLMQAGSEVTMTVLSENGNAVIGIPRGKVHGTWKRSEDKVLIYKYGEEGVFTEIQLVDGQLMYAIARGKGEIKLVGEKIAQTTE